MFSNLKGITPYAALLLELTRRNLEQYVEPWAVRHVAPALAGDVDAAASLAVAVSNAKRGIVAVMFWQAKVSVPAFATLLISVWDHDHQELIAAAETRRRLRAMFRYAKYQIPEEFSTTVRVWRGTNYLTVKQASKGISWTTDRDVACWFAMRFAGVHARPLVLSTFVPKDSILCYSNDRSESEAVIFDIGDVTVDGTPEDWQERRAARDAEQKAEYEKWKAGITPGTDQTDHTVDAKKNHGIVEYQTT